MGATASQAAASGGPSQFSRCARLEEERERLKSFLLVLRESEAKDSAADEPERFRQPGHGYGNGPSELRPFRLPQFVLENLKSYLKERVLKGKLPSEDAAEAEAERICAKLEHGWVEAMSAAGRKKPEVLTKLAEEYKFNIINTKLEEAKTCEDMIQAITLYTRNMISSELVETMASNELTEAYHYQALSIIRPELRRALDLEETAELRQIKKAMEGIKARGLEETVESCHTQKAIGQLKKAMVVEEETNGYYTEQTITLLMEEIEIYYAVKVKPISMERLQKLLDCGRYSPVFSPEVIKNFREMFFISKKLHPRLEAALVNSGRDRYAQSSTMANGVNSYPSFSRQAPQNVEIQISHDVEAPKVPNVVSEMEANKMFVSTLSQAAVGVMTTGSVNSSVLKFFSIAALTGFLGCLWAMYLQRNQTWAKWLSKIGAVGSTCAIIVALSMNFANDKNFTAFFTVVTLACVMSGALIMRS